MAYALNMVEPTGATKSVGDLIEDGRRAFADGDLHRAEARGREAFALARSADAAVLLACALFRRQMLDDALSWAQRASTLEPDSHAAHNTLGVILRARGDIEEARAAYERAIALAPGRGDLHHNLGNLLAGTGDVQGALTSYRLACRLGDETARASLDRACAAVLGRACDRLNHGAPEETLALVDLVTADRPDDADAHYLLAHARTRLGDGAGGAAAARRVVELRPGEARGWSALAAALRSDGQMAEAEAAYRRAVELEPDDAACLLRLASLLIDNGKLEEARTQTLSAAERAPSSERPHSLEAVIWQKAGQLRRARDCLLEAERRAPSTIVDLQLVSRLSVMGQLGDLDGRLRAEATLREILARPGPLQAEAEDTLFRLAFLIQFYDLPDEDLWRSLRDLGQRIARTVPVRPAPLPRARGGRLRIGYLSPNLGEHPTGHLVTPLLEAHDRRRFELFAYSTMDRTRDPGHYPARLRRAVDHWRDLHDQQDAVIAHQIETDGIDVLVDLGGYLAGGRPGVMARRAAPVQIHWIMHLAGMPAPFDDYTVVDEVMVPLPTRDELHGPLIRLANSFQPGYRQPVADDPGTRAAWGLPADGPVFCAFNNPLKIDHEAFAAWMAILRAVPGSTLWLSGKQRLEGLDRAAVEHGIDPKRIAYAPFVGDRSVHLARQRLADLYLDSFTFGGATSSMDALLAGLPVLTRRGSRAFGRVGASFLHTLGLTELIAPDTSSYVERAIELVRSPDVLAALRREVALRVAHGPLFDAARFARDMEAAFMATVERRRAGLPPASLRVDRHHRVNA